MERRAQQAMLLLAAAGLSIPLFPISLRLVHISFFWAQAFAVIVLLMVAVWVVLMVGSSAYRPNVKNPVVQGVLVLVGANLALLPFALDPSIAFWSQPLRMTGVLFLLLLGLFTLALIHGRFSETDWRNLLRWNTAVATLLAVSGVVTAFLEPGERIVGTFENPILFGQYLLVCFFVAMYLWQTSTRPFERHVLSFSLAMIVLGLLFTFSRGPLMGFVVGGLVFLAAFGWSSAKHARMWRRLALAGIGVAAFAVVLYLFLRLLPPGQALVEQLPPIIGRLVYGNLTQRPLVWHLAITAWLDAPLVGWGYETFGELFVRYLDVDGAHSGLHERGFDRPHNEFVYILVSTGFIGLAATVFYWVQACRAVIAQRKHVPIYASFLAVFVAYLVSVQFIFVVISASVVLALAIAFVGREEEKKGRAFQFRPVAAGVSLVVAVGLIVQIGVQPVAMAVNANRVVNEIIIERDLVVRTDRLADVKQALDQNVPYADTLTERTLDVLTPIFEQDGVEDALEVLR